MCAMCDGADADSRISIKIQKHQPCAVEEGAKPAQMEFANSDDAPLVVDEDNPGCYKIKGNVLVRMPIAGVLETYAEVKSRPTSDERPMDCKNYDPKTDYGGFGSCVYGSSDCDSTAFKSTNIGIRRNGETLQCGKPIHLEAGNLKDIEMSFCMPTKADFMSSQNLTESTWKDLQRARGSSDGSQRVYLTLYVFNLRASVFMHDQRKWLAGKARDRDAALQTNWARDNAARRAKGESELLPPVLGLPYECTDDEFDNLPMQRAIRKDPKFIACHKVLADLFLPS